MPQFTAPDGARIHYTDDGHGIALLCLAGLTRDGRDFDDVAPHLPPLRMIRMDYRGRGRSDWTGADTYTVPTEAADALALLDHLGVERAALLGTSRGGLIGLYLGATAPERLRGICLNDVGPVIERASLERIARYIGQTPDARSHAAAAIMLERGALGFANVPPERWFAHAERSFRQTDQGLQLTYDPALRTAFLAAMTGDTGDLWALFDACADLPLALIRGAGSDLLSQATADKMLRRRPDMLFADVPDRGHVPFLDEPEALRVLHRFLGQCL